jgi:hypothetical protein
MNIELLEVSNDNKILDNKTFDFSQHLFLLLSKSDFSKLGVSKNIKVKLDGEDVDLKICELSPFIRSTIIRFLEEFLVEILSERLEKLGDSPSSNEFKEYTLDLRELTILVKSLKNTKYTHLKRL